MLLNIALHGMEEAAGVRYLRRDTYGGRDQGGLTGAVRYADDFVVMCHTRHQAEQVWHRLAGEVDTLGSDHCCFSTAQKTEHSHDVTEMPNGMPGVETRLPVAYTQLVVRDGLPIERFVALFATNPARLNGLSGKGAIAVGNDADLVVLDPHSTRTVATQDLHMATDYSPYEGLVLTGWPSAVVSGGRVVWDADGFHDPGAIGRTLHADPLPEHLLT